MKSYVSGATDWASTARIPALQHNQSNQHQLSHSQHRQLRELSTTREAAWFVISVDSVCLTIWIFCQTESGHA